MVTICFTMQVMLRQFILHDLLVRLHILFSLSVVSLPLASKFHLLMANTLKKLSLKHNFHRTRMRRRLNWSGRAIPMKNKVMTVLKQISLQGQLKRGSPQKSLSLKELRRTFFHVINTWYVQLHWELLSSETDLNMH